MSVLAGLDPRLRPLAEAAVSALRAAGYNPQVTSGRRSITSQTRLYRLYLAGRHPYPVARPGTSLHELGLAWDMVTAHPEVVGPWLEGAGLTWGGRFKDPVHYDARILR